MKLSQITKHPIFVYDGECGICNKSVQFLLNHEKSDELFFVSFQSAIGKELADKIGFDAEALSTAIFIAGNKMSTKSNAILESSAYLKSPFNLIVLLKIIPKFIRDFIYDWIARNRNKLSKQVDCKLVHKDQASRIFTNL